MVPSSSADVTRALRGCSRGIFAYVLFKRQKKTSKLWGCL